MRVLNSGRWPTPIHLLPILFAGLLAGCGLMPEEEEPEEPEITFDDAEPLEVGESHIFEFPADSLWHASPYLAYKKHKIRVRAAGRAQALQDDIIEFRIGQMTQLVSDRSEFRVSHPGPLHFRLDPRKTAGYRGSVQVEISRLP